jgi:phage shock protein E
MLQAIKTLLGFGPAVDYSELLRQGAMIVDVRSASEYAQGHIKGSLHIPLDTLASNLHKLKNKDAPIITCCASGMRSASAKGVLQAQGYTHVYNGGGWQSLQQKLRR